MILPTSDTCKGSRMFSLQPGGPHDNTQCSTAGNVLARFCKDADEFTFVLIENKLDRHHQF
jgi:hypothetical protein